MRPVRQPQDTIHVQMGFALYSIQGVVSAFFCRAKINTLMCMKVKVNLTSHNWQFYSYSHSDPLLKGDFVTVFSQSFWSCTQRKVLWNCYWHINILYFSFKNEWQIPQKLKKSLTDCCLPLPNQVNAHMCVLTNSQPPKYNQLSVKSTENFFLVYFVHLNPLLKFVAWNLKYIKNSLFFIRSFKNQRSGVKIFPEIAVISGWRSNPVGSPGILLPSKGNCYATLWYLRSFYHLPIPFNSWDDC